MNNGKSEWIWQRRAILVVIFVITAAWRYLRPDCIIPGVKIIADQAFASRYPAFIVGNILLFALDILLNLRGGYTYTKIGKVADVVGVLTVCYQTFFAPPVEWY